MTAVVLECLFQYAKTDATQGGTIDAFVQVSKWADVGFEVAQDAAAVLVNYIGSLSKAEAAKTIVWMALISIAIETIYNEINSGQKEVLVSVGKVSIPASGFATKPPDQGCKGDEELTKDSVSPIVISHFLEADFVAAHMPKLRLSWGKRQDFAQL